MSDLISREELLNEINLLKESPWCNDDYTTVKLVRKDAIDVVERCVEKAPSVAEWISVKDRLPDEIGKYLVYVENIADYHILPDNIIIAVWAFKDWNFGGWEYNRVTHWMPLPEPPKENDVE